MFFTRAHFYRKLYEWIYFSRSKLALRVKYELKGSIALLRASSTASDFFHDVLSNLVPYSGCIYVFGVGDVDEF